MIKSNEQVCICSAERACASTSQVKRGNKPASVSLLNELHFSASLVARYNSFALYLVCEILTMGPLADICF